MRIPATISLSENGVFIAGIDVTAECTVQRIYGEDEPSITVEALWIEETNIIGPNKKIDLLNATTPALKALGEFGKHQLENDGDFACQALERAGHYLDGPAMDPSSKWRQYA